MQTISSRRVWAQVAGLGTAGLLLNGAEKKKESKEEDVSPAEDLMREHGVLKRVLLVYREVIGRIDAKKDFPPDVVTDSAKLIRNFVENYHEKLEEDYLFPRFKKAGKEVDLVNTLYTQHQKGRLLTDRTLSLVSSKGDHAQLRQALHLFVRMYEPHEAREDTVLFPAFKEIVSEHEYDSLGEEFERKENQLFGGEGFEKNVNAIAAIEKRIGLYDLTQFTPNV